MKTVKTVLTGLFVTLMFNHATVVMASEGADCSSSGRIAAAQQFAGTLDARQTSEVNKSFLMSQFSVAYDVRCIEATNGPVAEDDCAFEKGNIQAISEGLEKRRATGTISDLNYAFLKSQLTSSSYIVSLTCDHN